MKKIYFKLIAMSLTLILSVSVVLMSTYAWLVLSKSPAVTGIQVVIGGGNTILTAPNIRHVTEEGTVYCYPGHFSDSLNFGRESTYDYLQQIGKLAPVSTTNGVNWFLPEYYSGEDKEVQEGWAASGSLKDISEFREDKKLEYANIAPTDENSEKILEGSYVYLDFWVVSPGGDFTLRVSTEEEDPESTSLTSSGGSFVIDLLVPEKGEDGYVLKQSKSSAAGAVRVGFLANNTILTDRTMEFYQESAYKDERFIKLKGTYNEPLIENEFTVSDRFLIYEPNCDFHPTDDQLDGHYVETKPLNWSNGKIRAQSARNITAQKKSVWAPAQNDHSTTAIAQDFYKAQLTRDWDDKNPDEVMELFYTNEMQGQISHRVNTGGFIESTKALQAYLNTDNDGVLRQDHDILSKNIAGATSDEDIYIIKLERNVPQRLRMFIWLEGQDVDCVDSVNSAHFAVNIELAGGSE